MKLNQIFVLRTLPGQDVSTADNPDGVAVFRMSELGGSAWSLQSGCFDIRYSSLDRALTGLGGIVEWPRWTPEAQAALRHLIEQCGRSCY